jgi:hypothetical protein
MVMAVWSSIEIPDGTILGKSSFLISFTRSFEPVIVDVQADKKQLAINNKNNNFFIFFSPQKYQFIWKCHQQ